MVRAGFTTVGNATELLDYGGLVSLEKAVKIWLSYYSTKWKITRRLYAVHLVQQFKRV